MLNDPSSSSWNLWSSPFPPSYKDLHHVASPPYSENFVDRISGALKHLKSNYSQQKNLNHKLRQEAKKPDADIRKIEKLMELGASILAPSSNGNTVLHHAAKAGNPALVIYFIRLGANIEAGNNVQYTPLHVAAACGRGAIVCVLLGFHANRKAKAGYGITPKALAEMYKNQYKRTEYRRIIDLLEDYDPPPPYHLYTSAGPAEDISVGLEAYGSTELKEDVRVGPGK